MELRHIRYFMAVAEEGSITKAAEKLMIAQPPLSRQIRELESELGVSLFTRGKGKSSALTPEGVIFLSYCEKIMALVNEAASCFGSPKKDKEKVSSAHVPASDNPALMEKARDLYVVLSAFMKEAGHD